MPRKTNDAELDVEALVAEVAELRKEVAALKKALSGARKSSGGADPRVDKLLEYMKGSAKVAKRLEKFGL